MRPDDSSVDDGTLGEIREHVDRALRDSGALGVFPTPIERIVQSAKLSIASDVSLDAGFFAKIYRSGADITGFWQTRIVPPLRPRCRNHPRRVRAIPTQCAS